MSNVQIAKKNRFDLINRLLIDEYALIHLDPRKDSVIVPAQFKSQEMLTLKISKLFRGNLDVSKERIVAELLFEDYFTCTIPMDCIWGASSYKGETFIWPDSAPGSLVSSSVATASQAPSDTNSTSPDAAPEPKRRKGHLTRVK
ncbi:MAG: hypothetical protein K1X79_03870 [Oligoflexia bacterium]|nr:hypothetical protein [Oligoflexia bacterium]